MFVTIAKGTVKSYSLLHRTPHHGEKFVSGRYYTSTKMTYIDFAVIKKVRSTY